MLSANLFYVFRPGVDEYQFALDTAVTPYAGGYVAGADYLNVVNTPGTSLAYSGLANQLLLGMAMEDTSYPLATGQTAKNRVGFGNQIYKVAVTGASSAAVANFRTVYLNADDYTHTLTRPTRGHEIGRILEWVTGTTCWVEGWPSWGHYILDLVGGSRELICIGQIGCTGTTGNVLTGIPMQHHGRIVDFFGIVATKATDVDVAIDINLELDGTNLTGGVVSWVAASAIAAKLAGTAITGITNEYHEGSLLDVEATYGTAGTASDPGILNLYIVVQKLPGQ